MRALVSIFLCTLLSMPWLTKLVITVDFFAHQDYIAANLCENRDQPELHCEGKCVLMQKLNMVEDQDPQPKPLPEILGFELSGFVQFDPETDMSTIMQRWLDDRNMSLSEILPRSSFIGDIFRPPRFIA
jgi:hypothetical protein